MMFIHNAVSILIISVALVLAFVGIFLGDLLSTGLLVVITVAFFASVIGFCKWNS